MGNYILTREIGSKIIKREFSSYERAYDFMYKEFKNICNSNVMQGNYIFVSFINLIEAQLIVSKNENSKKTFSWEINPGSFYQEEENIR